MTAKVQGKTKLVPPDGGWGWVVLTSALVVNFLIPGTVKSFGVLFVEFLQVFKASPTAASWMPALCYFLYSSLGPLSSVLSMKYSYKTVTLIGGAFAASGMMLSSFATSVTYLYVSYGLMVGIGAGLTFPPTIYIVTAYFEKLRGFANGLCISGSAIGTIVLPPFLQYLLNHFGHRGAVLIMGAITLNTLVCGLLYHPVGEHMKEVLITDEGGIDNEALTLDEPLNASTNKSTSDQEKKSQKKGQLPENTNQSEYFEKSLMHIIDENMPKKTDLNGLKVSADENSDILDDTTDTNKELEITNEKNCKLTMDSKKIESEEKNIEDTCTEIHSSSTSNNNKNNSYSNFGNNGIPNGFSGNTNGNNSDTNSSHNNSTINNVNNIKNNISRNSSNKSDKKNFNLSRQHSIVSDIGPPINLRHPRVNVPKNMRRFLVKSTTKTDATTNEKPEKTEKLNSTIARNTTDDKSTESFGKFFDFSVLRDPIYLIILISNSTSAISNTNFMILLPSYAIAEGFDKNMSALLLSIVSALDLVGRIGGASLSDIDFVPKYYYFVCGLGLSGIALALLPMASSYMMLSFFCALFGLSSGMYIGITTVILADMLGTEKLSSSYGISLFVNGVLQLVGPPVCGAIFESVGSYKPIFFAFGIILILGTALWAAVPLINRNRKNIDTVEC